MPQVCPRCHAPVNGRSTRCPECGTGLELARSTAVAEAARSHPLAVEPAAPSAPLFLDRPAFDALPADPPPAPAFEATPEPGKRAVVPPPRPARSPVPPPHYGVIPLPPVEPTPEPAEPTPEPVEPTPEPVEPAPGPIVPPTSLPPPEPVTSEALAGQGLYEIGGDVQGWMTRMLSGATDELPPVLQPAASLEPDARGESSYLPPPDPPMIFYPMLDEPEEDWSDASFPPFPALLAPAESPLAAGGGVSAVAGSLEALRLLSEELAAQVGLLDEPIEPAPELPAPTARIELLDRFGEWVDCGLVPAGGCVLGRHDVPDHVPDAEVLAVEHVALRYEGATLVADDVGSVDGVYRRLVEPVPLEDGQRFRIGGHVLEFRIAEGFAPVANLAAGDRGMLCSRDLEALGYVDLIRPNGQPGLRFPLTKRDATVIGREGPTASIALAGDPGVSTSHAQVRVCDGGFVLEDLKSRGGTFLQIQGPTPLRAGDVLQAGKLLLRIAEA
ncbi:MAG: FHA domain-containing protein [Isosphaeraceae bacterium]|nr:FHA domain-containing protein [Isosphaeraceae bacterium]